MSAAVLIARGEQTATDTIRRCCHRAISAILMVAPWRWWKAQPPAVIVTGVSTMLALGIVLNIIGLGFFFWVLFTLAIHALPVFVGMTAGLYAHNSGSGPLGAIALGIVAAAFVLVIGQTIFSFVRTPILRIAVALMFAAPAALAGYYATFGLSGLTMTSVVWRQVFAVIGAVVIGATAWARLAASPPDGLGGSERPALS